MPDDPDRDDRTQADVCAGCPGATSWWQPTGYPRREDFMQQVALPAVAAGELPQSEDAHHAA